MPKPSVLLSLLFAFSCQSQPGLDAVDKRYADVLARLNAADRDVARNIHNRDARWRKKAAEKARVAFFRESQINDTIVQARQGPEGSLERIKGEAYWRHAVYVRSWTDEEKERETELLARLDALAGAEASWSPAEGELQVPLSGSWSSVSKAADGFPQDQRAELAAEYVDHQLSMVGEDLRELIKLRNRVARREGYETYWHLALDNQGLKEEQVDALIKELEPAIRPVNKAYAEIVAGQAMALALRDSFANHPYLRRQAGLEAGRDEAEPYFDTDLAEGRILTSLRSMGIELEGWQVYSGPSRHTRRGAYSFPIRLPGTIALVVSQDRRFDAWQYEAIMHEAGHALRWASLNPEALQSPVLWDPPAAYTEGFAQLFERIMMGQAWTARYIPEMPEENRTNLAEWRARQMARWVTQSIVETAVERRAYEDPNNWPAVARFCAEIEQNYQIHAPDTPSDDNGVTYCKTLHTPLIWHYPAYVQNYIFSYVTEAQLYDALVNALGDPVDNDQVGPWLTENITQAGGTTPFQERLAKVSTDDRRSAPLARYIQVPTQAAEETP